MDPIIYESRCKIQQALREVQNIESITKNPASYINQHFDKIRCCALIPKVVPRKARHRFRIRRDPKWLLCKAQFNEKLSAQHIENIMTKQSEAKRV